MPENLVDAIQKQEKHQKSLNTLKSIHFKVKKQPYMIRHDDYIQSSY